MLSTPACHAPFTPAPQHSTTFADVKAPRNGSFNFYAPVCHSLCMIFMQVTLLKTTMPWWRHHKHYHYCYYDYYYHLVVVIVVVIATAVINNTKFILQQQQIRLSERYFYRPNSLCNPHLNKCISAIMLLSVEYSSHAYSQSSDEILLFQCNFTPRSMHNRTDVAMCLP